MTGSLAAASRKISDKEFSRVWHIIQIWCEKNSYGKGNTVGIDDRIGNADLRCRALCLFNMGKLMGRSNAAQTESEVYSRNICLPSGITVVKFTITKMRNTMIRFVKRAGFLSF